ncbi:hypothetical protein KL86DPRO_11329 [uncultured delta proteobacterium]|uniref:BON domain-containing protein n=1 Tax=uncultured delta proteobacterium TaxID=34034 RepID=A0A212JF53_9DELT|nr:hypothetical protein KL86DPRO_11329 [uncultured delta proteobacterium]
MDTPRVPREGSKPDVYPGSKPEAGKRDGGNVKSAVQPVTSAHGRTGDTSRVFQEGSKSNVYPGNRPGTGKIDDDDIEDAVERAVERYEDVSVDVDEGVVTLSGEVVSESDRENAITAARDVAGVRTVQDQMQVAGSGSQTVGKYFDDAGITTAVKGKLLAEKGLSSFKISVDTIDGVVTLTGDVKTQAQVDTAGAVARQVDGVKRVDNKVLVKP